jgi:hypothetical protein
MSFPALPLAALVAMLVALSVAPTASAAPRIGVGEQSPTMFSDPAWQDLGIQDVRVIAGWDALHRGWERREMDSYMANAHAAGARVLLGFGRSRPAGRQDVLPTPARYRREFAAWRERYPFIQDFVVWNEANHCSQPTCKRPDLVARYYNAARAQCPTCTLVGASVLDQPGMEDWVRTFNRRANDRRFVWGLHNYIDANRFRTTGTRALLRAAPKQEIWFTETGGLVWRKNSATRIPLNESSTHAAKAMRWLFNRLVPMSSRIKRVYLYHWMPNLGPDPTWDSALLDRRGRPRPAYEIVRKQVKRLRGTS